MTNRSVSVEHERELAAPRGVVFDLLLDAKVVRAWLAYEGAELRSLWLDARPGGGFHACIVVPYLGDVWAIGTYREVERPSRIVFDVGIREASGDGPAADESPSPNDVRVTMTLTEAGAGTRVTIERDASVSAPPGLPTWARMLDAVEGALG
ncbi:MAG: SRPBCC domain-containing protein [Myxococcales bacterium]|nr:SRPBCC domain-containing protein [Myxococcales bacterium]